MADSPTIAILGGTGKEGRGLALRLAAAGLPVVIGSRSVDRAHEAAWMIRQTATAAVVEGTDNADAVARGDVVVLAVPFAHVGETLDAAGRRYRTGALVIDVTVPVSFDGGAPRLVEVPEGSAAEHVRRRLAPEIPLAAALKTVPAHLLADLATPLDCDDFVCGDSDQTRARAIDLFRRIPGLRPLDVGPLEVARTLERMTLLAIALNRRYRVHDARFRIVGL